MANVSPPAPHETGFSGDDNFLKRGQVMVGTTKKAITPGKTTRSKQGNVMIKALSALAVAAFMASAITILPGFAPEVEASTSTPVLAKSDRLDIRPDCGTQSWPNFETKCLRTSDRRQVQEARLVTAIRR